MTWINCKENLVGTNYRQIFFLTTEKENIPIYTDERFHLTDARQRKEIYEFHFGFRKKNFDITRPNL